MSLILDMQKLIIDPNFNIRSLMFATLLASIKLKRNDIFNFCKSEIYGYNDNDFDIPSYRRIQIKIEQLNQKKEWESVKIRRDPREINAEFDLTSDVKVTESIFRLDDLSSRNEIFLMKIDSQEQFMNRNLLYDTMVPSRKVIYPHDSQKIIDAVRLSILEWVVRLEQEGITGDGLSFSPKQVVKASHMTFNISNTGNMAGLTLGNNNTTSTTQNVGDGNNVDIIKAKDLLAQIESMLESMSLEPEKLPEARNTIVNLNQEINKEKPDNDKVRGWFSSLGDAIGNAGIPIVAKAFGEQIQGLLS